MFILAIWPYIHSHVVEVLFPEAATSIFWTHFVDLIYGLTSLTFGPLGHGVWNRDPYMNTEGQPRKSKLYSCILLNLFMMFQEVWF